MIYTALGIAPTVGYGHSAQISTGSQDMYCEMNYLVQCSKPYY